MKTPTRNDGWLFRKTTASVVALLLSLACLAQSDETYWVAKVAGAENGLRGFFADFVPATESVLCEPSKVALDNRGSLYIAESCRHRIRKISPDGLITTVAGSDVEPGFAGDGGPALLARFNRPSSVAVDDGGNIYIADSFNGRIRRVTADGTINTVANVPGFDLAIDKAGNLYSAANSAIIRIRPDGTSTVIAGTTEFDPVTGQPRGDILLGAFGLTVDEAGNVYFAESRTHLIHKITPGGVLMTIAGQRFRSGFSGDGGPALEAKFSSPYDVDIDSEGNLYVADFHTSRIRKITPDGIVTTVAGGNPFVRTSLWGDGGRAIEARLSGPMGVAVGPGGTLYIADTRNARVRKVTPDGIIRTMAGGGGFNGDGQPAGHALVANPQTTAFDTAGHLYVADRDNHRIRKIDRDGVITTIAGNGESGFSGDGGPATEARLSWPTGVAVDAWGSVFVADTVNNRVRKVTPDGMIDTIAGNGAYAFRGEGEPARDAFVAGPVGLAVDSQGNLYVADTDNHRVRKITPEGIITTIAGTGEVGAAGDGGPAIQAQLIIPTGVAIGPDGTLYIADPPSFRVRKVSRDGIIATVAGTGTAGSGGDRGPATQALLRFPQSVAVDTAGNLFIADSANSRIRRVTPDGIIDTLEFQDAFEPERPFRIHHPNRVAIGPLGDLYFSRRNHIFHASKSQAHLVEPLPEISFTGLRQGASLVFGPIAPGMIVSVFGARLGPRDGRGATVTAAGAIETSLADTLVLFNRIPAPLLFVQAGQINAVAPFGLEGSKVAEIQVVRRGRASNIIRVPLLPAVPGIFTLSSSGFGNAAAINQDGTINSGDNPASRGSIVAIFATGAGQTDPPGEDGKLALDELPVPLLPISAEIGGLPARVFYTGAAPGFVAGALQVNVQVPQELDLERLFYVSLVLRVGNAPSRRVMLSVR